MSDKGTPKMLRWMLGIRRVEKIRNEDIRVRVRVLNVREEIREARLFWLGHIERKGKGSGGEESMDTGSTRKETKRKTKIKMEICTDKGHGGKET